MPGLNGQRHIINHTLPFKDANKIADFKSGSGGDRQTGVPLIPRERVGIADQGYQPSGTTSTRLARIQIMLLAPALA